MKIQRLKAKETFQGKKRQGKGEWGGGGKFPTGEHQWKSRGGAKPADFWEISESGKGRRGRVRRMSHGIPPRLK